MRGDFEIRPFGERADFLLMNRWLKERGLPETKAELVPQLGFVAVKLKTPFCMGFIRQCEGGVGILDSLITDPKASLFTRHLAIELVVRTIKEEAKTMGYKRLLAMSTDKGTIKRSLWHGFKIQPHQVISLSL